MVLLSLGALGAEQDTDTGTDAEEERAPTVQDSLPGWHPAVFPPEGMTKEHFRANYGRAWDAVSRALGGRLRAALALQAGRILVFHFRFGNQLSKPHKRGSNADLPYPQLAAARFDRHFVLKVYRKYVFI